MDDARAPLRVAEVFGLDPPRTRLREAILTLRGDPLTPPSRFDHTSLKMFRPRMALPLWAGRPARGRTVPIYNLFSHVRPPPEAGWSVRVTTARDFLGTQLTYDSHNGTDFAVPIGTVVVAAAPGVVRRVSSEFNRGGLKVFIDHGAGVVTTSNHLARALVCVGERVRRGQPVALSGYSGLDGLTTFPWGAPHVHFNVWLDGEYVDPFARPGETALWRNGNWPTAHTGGDDDAFEATDWDDDAMARALGNCLHDGSRREVESTPDRDARAMALLFHMNYYPTRFRERPGLYRTTHPRAPTLDLPFRAEDFDGVWFPHGVEPAR
ncbi:MAG: M23 family metallopeptidase [Polyangiales bacterium]